MPRLQVGLGILVLAAIGFWGWRGGSSDERAIRSMFQEFATEFNSGTSDPLGLLARAAHISEYFTPDVVIELGQGAQPIQGRDTLVGMATRLQPRTSAFVVEMDDVTVELTGPESADVTFTTLFRRRSHGSGEESIDAREFAAHVVRGDGRWRVQRVVAVDTLR